ncbi:MAG: hypothetical protein DME08_03640 [Candidatus Rokuibacteriota bacterium]|nr:MAG: hypothetical protein DME08_03640 [Candidatus Rokubacteria bacterium]
MVATTPGPERDPHDPAASDPAPHPRRLRGAAGVRGRAAAASAAAAQRPARPAHRLRDRQAPSASSASGLIAHRGRPLAGRGRLTRPACVSRLRRRMPRASRFLALLLMASAVVGCGGPTLDPEAERGRQVYLAQCTACHATDPAQAGPVGPPLKGSTRELLESKVLRGTSPPGYRPKRPTAVMPPQPQVANDIPALAAYLK